jgi:DNA-binding CsgD family transcriptional regulator
MEVSRLYSWIVFIFCVALAAGGALVLFRKVVRREYPAFRYLQYFLILTYTFGFYGFWSRLWFRILFKSSDTYGTLASVADFLGVISIPFWLVAQLMLVLWAVQLPVRRRATLWYACGSSSGVGVLLLYLALVVSNGPFTTWQWYAGLALPVLTFVASLLLFAPVRYLTAPAARRLAGLVLLTGAVHVPLLFGAAEQPFFELAFIFLYFLGHTALGVCFVYMAAPPEPAEESTLEMEREKVDSFEQFIEKYGITAREAEVAREIYQGKANKEIAGKLFVTVQTIKDHTHRIYQKTNVKSRSQLASLMRGFQP